MASAPDSPPATPAPPPAPTPAPASSAAGADAAVTEALKGTLLGGLLNPEEPLFDGSYIGKGEDKPVETPEEKPAAPPPAPTTEPPKTAEKVVKKTERRPVSQPTVRQEPIDVERIAVAAATATLEAQSRLKAEEDRRRQDVELPPEVAKYAGIYDEMHRTNPEKYPADLKGRMARYVQEEKLRASKWEAAHPGEKYNNRDEEHEEWYDANQPKVDEDDFEDARIGIKAEQRAREIVNREVVPATRQLQEQIQRQTIEPELVQKARSLGPSILKALAPDFDGTLSKEAVEKIAAEDPVAWDVAQRVDNAFGTIVLEAGLMWKSSKKYDENNPAHVGAKKVLEQFEDDLSTMNPNELRKGKLQWAPIASYARMTEAERSSHYTIEYDDMVNYIRTHLAPSEAKRIYEQQTEQSKGLVEKLAKKYGYQKSTVANSQQSVPEQTSTPAPSIASPSVSAGSPPPAPGMQVPAGESGGEDEFFKRMMMG